MKKILIGNGREIALRIMYSAKEIGIKTVAVFSEADRMALHVRYADEAVCIGLVVSNQSYLAGQKIIDALKQTGSEAIHPGNGFLSKNTAFVPEAKAANLILIGQTPGIMARMKNKLPAKARLKCNNNQKTAGLD